MNREERLIEKGLPANPLAERAVLGSCLLADRIGELGDLQPDDFHLDAHRKIYRAMLRLWAEKVEIDFLSLGADLERTHDLESVQGYEYLSQLTEGLPRGLNVGHYAGIVRARAAERRLLALAADVQSRIVAGASAGDAIAALERGIEQVRERGGKDAAAGPLLVPAHRFIASAPERIDWLVEGIIPRGASGFIAADPKGGKSWVGADLALALACGGDEWLGFRIPAPARVVLISREDPQALTGWRMKNLARGRNLPMGAALDNLWCNSQSQSPTLDLEDRAEVAALMSELKLRRPDLVILDVFNVMHSADENDNTEMRQVLKVVSRMSYDLDGCAFCIAHHFNKSGEGSIVKRLRGSGAIGGFAQWLVGLTMADEARQLRRAEFELKAASQPKTRTFRIESSEELKLSRIQLENYEPEPVRKRSAAAIIGGQQWNNN